MIAENCHRGGVLLLTLAALTTLAVSAQSQEAALLTNVRQVTFEGRRAGEGYFSADGARLVFQSEREPSNPFFQIYVLDLETGETRRASPGIGKTTCAWLHPASADRVLFASTHADPAAVATQERELEERRSGRERRYAWDYDEWFDLYETQLGTDTHRNLTDAVGYDAEGSWSRNGEWIVFASNRHAYAAALSPEEQALFETDKSYFVDIYLMRADGSDVRRLTTTPGYDGGPFFSPDGRRIVWRRFSEDGSTAEIYSMHLDGGDVRQITALGALSWAPFYHPSGDYLVFATNLHGFGNFELYLVDVDGRTDPVRVTWTNGFDGLPAFSPDGRTLAWTTNRSPDAQSQIFFGDWNHDAARRLLGIASEDTTAASRSPITGSAIRAEDMRVHALALTSEEAAGRMTGTAGERLAAAYLAARFKEMGLEPAGDDGEYLQAFQFASGVSLGTDNELALHASNIERAQHLTLDSEWRPLAFSAVGAVERKPIVFAGYGIVAPEEGQHPAYDAYVHLDVGGKWVMTLRDVPEDVSPGYRQHLSRFASLRYKALHARERGAAGIIFVSGPRSLAKDEVLPLTFDASQGSMSLAAVSVSDAVAERMLESTDTTLAALQEELDAGQLAMGFEIPGVTLAGRIDVRRDMSTAYNVLARLRADTLAVAGTAVGNGGGLTGRASAPGLSSGAERRDRPSVLIGAHYDHLGLGGGGNSLARSDEAGRIHPGADDNASGTAIVLEIAEELAAVKRAGRLPMQRDAIFGLWSGEELGLLGSAHFAEQYDLDGDSTNLEAELAAALNLDMVGRLTDRLVLQGVGSSTDWRSEVERANVRVGLPIVTQNDSYLPTDATSFYLKKVPILSAFTGLHGEYHTPRDTPNLLNYEGMEKVGALMSRIMQSLVARAEPLDYQEMARPETARGRSGMRAYLGTIPDYAQTDRQGVRLSGVIDGGPAERAGLRGGDVIVELSGRQIENIYDYTYAIDALKVGEGVEVVVLRGGDRVEIEVVPESRQ